MKAFDLGFEVLPKFVGRMRGWPWEGYHLDVGTHEALEKARRDAPGLRAKGTRPAVFLDRDGTVIEHVHYHLRPDQGQAPARRRPRPSARLGDAGYALVVITNQSAIGRGYDHGRAVRAGQRRDGPPTPAAEGVTLDGVYYCPEAPTVDDPTRRSPTADRKPGPGMLLRAARELGLDLSTSWMVGDMISDVLAGVNAGCKGSLLVETGKEPAGADAPPGLDPTIAPNLSAAADLILGPSDDRAADDVSDAPKGGHS